MGYKITPSLLAKYNNCKVILSGKAVREFRQRNLQPKEGYKQLNGKPVEVKVDKWKPDNEVPNSNGMKPMVIIERLKNVPNVVSKKTPTKLMKSKSTETKSTPAKSAQTKIKGAKKTPEKMKTPARKPAAKKAAAVKKAAAAKKASAEKAPAMKVAPNDSKSKRGNVKKAAQAKQKSAKRSRPQFILTPVQKKRNQKKTKESQSHAVNA